MNFLLKMPLPLVALIFFILIPFVANTEIVGAEEQQEEAENSQDAATEESNGPEIAIKKQQRYAFTPAETHRLLMFFLVNLRPWKQRIPQELVDFMEGKLPTKKATIDQEIQQQGDSENEGQEKFSLNSWMKKMLNIKNKGGIKKNLRKLVKRAVKKERVGGRQYCANCGGHQTDGEGGGGGKNGRKQQKQQINGPKMVNIELSGQQDGQAMVRQFSGPMNDLLASIINQDEPIGDILGAFENEIENGIKRGWYSESAVSTLKEVVTILRGRIKNRLLPEGTLQVYYAHTMLYQYFLGLFTRFIDQTKYQPGLFGNSPVLRQSQFKDGFVQKLLEGKPWEDKQLNLAKTVTDDFNLSKFNAGSKREKHINFIMDGPLNNSDKLGRIIEIALEIGIKLFSKENVKIVKQICANLIAIMEKMGSTEEENQPIERAAAVKMAADLNYFPKRLAKYEKAIIGKNEEIRQRILNGKSDLSQSGELFGAARRVHALNEERGDIEQSWQHLLHEIGIMLIMSPKFNDLLISSKTSNLKKMDQLSQIGVELIEHGQSRGNKMLAMLITLAQGKMLEKHLEKIEIDYERQKVNEHLEKVKEALEIMEENQWYPSLLLEENIIKKGMDKEVRWPEMVEEFSELTKWFHASEPMRFLLNHEKMFNDEISKLDNINIQMELASNKIEEERASQIDTTLRQGEAALTNLIKNNPNKKKIDAFKLILSKIAVYKEQKVKALKMNDEILKKREKWQPKLAEAKKSPELKMVEEAELELRKYEEERQRLSREYIEIILALGGITTANKNEMQKIKVETELGQVERLEKFKKVLEKAKRNNLLLKIPSQQRPFLNDQNAKIKILIKKIEDQIKAEENWQYEKERIKLVHRNVLEKLDEKSIAVDNEFWGVKNHFMLQTLFGDEYHEYIEDFNSGMEKLAEFYNEIIWSIQMMEEDIRGQLQLIGILKERQQANGQWIQRDDAGMEMRYRMVLGGVQQNQQRQRKILYEFFDNYSDMLDMNSLSHIKPIRNSEEAKIFDAQFSLAEAVTFIDWLSKFNFDLDLVNNPTGIIDILSDKLDDVLAKLSEDKVAKKKVKYDFLSDYANDPVKNENQEEYYNRMSGTNREEIESKIARQKIEFLQKALQTTILMLIGMQKSFDDLLLQAESPKQIQHQIMLVDRPMKLNIPLEGNEPVSKGKFLLYSLFTFGECLIGEFKSNEKAINRLLKLGLKKIREDQLLRNRLAMPEVEFRTVEFERRFSEHFVNGIFSKYSFDEILSPSIEEGEEEREENDNGLKKGSLGDKMFKDGMEKMQAEFKTNLRKQMCQFSSINTDEEREESIQLLDDTIKKIYYQPRMVKAGAPPPPDLGGFNKKRKAKSSKISFNPIRFLNGGYALTVKSRLSKSIWRNYPIRDPVDKDFADKIREYLIGMYAKKDESKLVDRFKKANIIFPYEQKREGLQVALLLKELLKVNNKILNPEAKKGKKGFGGESSGGGGIKEEKLEGMNGGGGGHDGEKMMGRRREILAKIQPNQMETEQKSHIGEKGVEKVMNIDENENEKENGKMLQNISEGVLKRRKREVKKQISLNNSEGGGNDDNGVGKKKIIKYRVDAFFNEKMDRTDDKEDEFDIPIKALPIYRLLKSMMADTFNWQIDKNVQQIAPMMKASGFPGLTELQMYLDEKIDFSQLTDELDQFCFIVAHSKRNVHMQLKVLYYRWKALKVISENGRRLTAFEGVIKILKAYELPLQKFIYRLVDYTNYVNQYTDGFQHVFGFSLKSLTEFLNRKMNLPGGSEFRIADLIVEDFAVRGEMNQIYELLKMVEEIKEKTSGAKFVGLLEIRNSVQDILQVRLNLLTEVIAKTSDKEEEGEKQQEVEINKKDWHFGKKESAKHVAILKDVYSDKFHNLISRLNNFWRHEERLRDYFCYDSCQGSAESAATGNAKFDFTKVVFELERALGLIQSAIAKYKEKIRLENEKEKRKAEQAKKVKNGVQQKDGEFNFEKLKMELEKARANFIKRQEAAEHRESKLSDRADEAVQLNKAEQPNGGIKLGGATHRAVNQQEVTE